MLPIWTSSGDLRIMSACRATRKVSSARAQRRLSRHPAASESTWRLTPSDAVPFRVNVPQGYRQRFEIAALDLPICSVSVTGTQDQIVRARARPLPAGRPRPDPRRRPESRPVQPRVAEALLIASERLCQDRAGCCASRPCARRVSSSMPTTTDSVGVRSEGSPDPSCRNPSDRRRSDRSGWRWESIRPACRLPSKRPARPRIRQFGVYLPTSFSMSAISRGRAALNTLHPSSVTTTISSMRMPMFSSGI